MPFPNSPTNGQTYVLNNTSYTYNSAQGTWTATQAGVSTPIVIAANTAATSTGTGALQVVGGIGVQGNVYTANVGFADGSVFGSASSLGTRNRIINGAMQFWQRGTSFSGTSSLTYTADRWNNGQQTGTYSQSSSAPTGYTYCLNIVSSSSYYGTVEQRIESYNCVDLVGQSVTVSFWANATVGGASGLTIGLAYANSTDNFSTTTNISTSTTAALSSTWTRYTATFNSLPSGTANGLRLYIYNSAGGAAAITWNITGVQLEQGSVATPFERRQYGQEQQLCERYFEIVPFVLVTNISAAYTSNRWRTLKRAAPTLALVSSEGGSGATFTNLNQYPSGGFYQTANHSGPSIAAVSGSAEL